MGEPKVNLLGHACHDECSVPCPWARIEELERDARSTGRRPPRPRTTTAIRFPDPLHDQLRKAADDRDFSINYLVVKAVEYFLPRLKTPEETKLTND